MNKSVVFMARNPVAANLLMLLLVVGGLIFVNTIKREVFPEIELDAVTVSVVYPGAGPKEVESGVCLPVEEAISGVFGIDTLRCLAFEGAGTITAEVLSDADSDEVLQDIKSEVDRIRTFPEDAEEPIVAKIALRKEVLSLAVFGDVSERTIREQSEKIRDDLLELPQISQVDLGGVRNYEISVEVSEDRLQKYGLTLAQISQRIRQASVDIPGGVVKTRGGEVLLRTNERRYLGKEFSNISVKSSNDGAEVTLAQIATISDTFEEVDLAGTFDGKNSALVKVYRVGKQGPIEISDVVKQYVDRKTKELPDAINLAIWNDRSEIFASRLELLLRNAYIGLILVFLILGAFLELRLAFWVTMGIPISFLGALLLIPTTDVSINMISLFAFILSLGIVVDDAIVVGENVYEHRNRGKSYLKAAIDGTREVGKAVIFAVLTSCAAFLPMLMVTGTMGKFMRVIPIIVISVLLISLIESLYILPAHLAHSSSEPLDRTPFLGKFFSRIEDKRKHFMHWLDWFISNVFRPSLKKATSARYVTLALGFAVLVIMSGVIAGGYLKIVHMPNVDGDVVKASLEMPIGTPIEQTEKIAALLVEKAKAVVSEVDSKRETEKSVLRNIYALVGGLIQLGGHGRPSNAGGSNVASVAVFLKPGDQRGSFGSDEFADLWRNKVGEIAGVKSLTFAANLMREGPNLNLQLVHNDYRVLKEAAARVKVAMLAYSGVSDVSDNLSSGKRELKFKLKQEASSLGITESNLGRQVRAAFYGEEALRFQRGRNELRVLVRYPPNERQSLGNLENMRIRTALGQEVPFSSVATVEDSVGYSVVRRSERKRVVNITAEVELSVATPQEILSDLNRELIPQLKADYPELKFEIEGQEKERADSNKSLFKGFIFALLLIYVLLAIPFKSYLQPVIVMSAIPFGVVGAALGHLLLGKDMSLLSMCGIVALSGVVVNDSLIMVDYINQARERGEGIYQAVIDSGCRRFRPIILTSLTTFFGLSPIILERSLQAQFLIPMAISLAFGVMFATVITLYLIPCFYLILEDAKSWFASFWQRLVMGSKQA